MLRKLRGTFVALCALSAMALIPMMTIHLSAGYGDIHLITYGLLSFLALAITLEHDKRWLVLSSLMVLGALWSKSEGLYFVFVPWVVALMLLGWKQEVSKPRLIKNILISCVPFLPFLALLIFKGLSLTPHESDGTFGIKWEGFAALPHALFGSGSFGVLWYALIIVIVTLIIKKRVTHFALLAMALVSLFGILFVYLFTPNVGFLLNGQSFYRQMLLPAVMLISWCALHVKGTVQNS